MWMTFRRKLLYTRCHQGNNQDRYIGFGRRLRSAIWCHNLLGSFIRLLCIQSPCFRSQLSLAHICSLRIFNYTYNTFHKLLYLHLHPCLNKAFSTNCIFAPPKSNIIPCLHLLQQYICAMPLRLPSFVSGVLLIRIYTIVQSLAQPSASAFVLLGVCTSYRAKWYGVLWSGSLIDQLLLSPDIVQLKGKHGRRTYCARRGQIMVTGGLNYRVRRPILPKMDKLVISFWSNFDYRDIWKLVRGLSYKPKVNVIWMHIIIGLRTFLIRKRWPTRG